METSHANNLLNNVSSGTFKRSSYTTGYPTAQRCMAFVDITSYTSFTHVHGNHAAASMVADFRSIVRTTAEQHGVRVARWLGDGVMLVGTQANKVIESLCVITSQCYDNDIPVHSGVAQGEVVIFEDNDYLGRIVNIAARLSSAANDSELYCHQIPDDQLPSRLDSERIHNLDVKGIGSLQEVIRLRLL
jgi:adenylate cyclase